MKDEGIPKIRDVVPSPRGMVCVEIYLIVSTRPDLGLSPFLATPNDYDLHRKLGVDRKAKREQLTSLSIPSRANSGHANTPRVAQRYHGSMALIVVHEEIYPWP